MVQTIFRVIIIVIIIAVVLAVLGSVLIQFSIGLQYSSLLKSFFQCACYILPFKQLMPIFVVLVAVIVFRFSVTLMKTIWALFPLRG